MTTPSPLPSINTVRRGWIAAIASALLPGWGQFYAGERRLAYQLFVIDVLFLVPVLVILLWFRLEILKLWVTPAALVMILGVNLALLVFRALVAGNAYLAVPSNERPTWITGLGVAAAGLLIVIPHVVVGYLTFVQYDLIETVFADPVPVAGSGVTTTGPVTSTSPPAAGSSTIAPTTTTKASTTTTTVPPIWDGLDRLNIVLLGADAGAGRIGLRTDTMIVVSIDPGTGSTVIVSVPRDLSNAPLPEGMGLWSCNCYPDLFGHLYDAGERYPDAFPGSGEPPINAIKAALGEIFGMPIHYYAMVTLDGFVGVVDALGGVNIEVPETIVDNTYPHENGSFGRVVIEKGTQHLDGHLALAYARIRRGSSDVARMHRQRCVLGAVVEQTDPIELIANYGHLADALKEHLRTDIPQDRLVDFVDLIPKITTDRIATLRISRTVYQTGAAPGRVYYDIDRIRADAQALIADPEAAQAELGLQPLHGTCEE